MIASGALAAVSTVELTIRMVVALVVVTALLTVLTRSMRRYLQGRHLDRPHIEIRHQQQLNKHASVTLLTAGGRHLLVGSNSQSIVVLAEGDDLTVGSAAKPSADPPAAIDIRTRPRPNPIRALQNKTVRRG